MTDWTPQNTDLMKKDYSDRITGFVSFENGAWDASISDSAHLLMTKPLGEFDTKEKAMTACDSSVNSNGGASVLEKLADTQRQDSDIKRLIDNHEEVKCGNCGEDYDGLHSCESCGSSVWYGFDSCEGCGSLYCDGSDCPADDTEEDESED